MEMHMEMEIEMRREMEMRRQIDRGKILRGISWEKEI
jgi:hypothetical protein